MLDLLIRGGEVVTPQGVGKWSVGVQGEKIAFIGTDEHAPQAGRTIDAGGKIVVPGGIEPHAHLDIYDLTNPDAGVSTLGPEEDTRGMAFGGTTTHLDFCFIEPGMDITQGIETRAARWSSMWRLCGRISLIHSRRRTFPSALMIPMAQPEGC